MNDFPLEPISQRPQTLAIVGSICLFILIAQLVKKGHLRSGYSVVWFLTVLFILVLSVFNGFKFWFSNLIGIYYAPAAIFSVLIIGIIIISVHYSVVISKHEKEIKMLAEEIAILKLKFKKLKK